MSNIPGSAHANLSLGGLVIIGGAIGHIKKGSKISLIAGLSIGSLLLGSGYMIAKTDKQFEAHCLAASATGVMALAMGSRFVKTGKFMPAGLVASLGVAGCAYNVHKALEWAPAKDGMRRVVHFHCKDLWKKSFFDSHPSFFVSVSQSNFCGGKIAVVSHPALQYARQHRESSPADWFKPCTRLILNSKVVKGFFMLQHVLWCVVIVEKRCPCPEAEARSLCVLLSEAFVESELSLREAPPERRATALPRTIRQTHTIHGSKHQPWC